MNEIEIEAAIEALRTLASRLETLRHREPTDHELPEQQKPATTLLEDAYAALTRIETTVDKLGQELEYHHARLGKTLEPDDREERSRLSNAKFCHTSLIEANLSGTDLTGANLVRR